MIQPQLSVATATTAIQTTIALHLDHTAARFLVSHPHPAPMIHAPIGDAVPSLQPKVVGAAGAKTGPPEEGAPIRRPLCDPSAHSHTSAEKTPQG